MDVIILVAVVVAIGYFVYRKVPSVKAKIDAVLPKKD